MDTDVVFLTILSGFLIVKLSFIIFDECIQDAKPSQNMVMDESTYSSL